MFEPIVPDYGDDPATYHQLGKTIGVFGGKFFPLHNGHMGFLHKAATMVDILFVAVQYDEEHESSLCEGTPFIPVSPKQRVAWLTEELKDYPDIRVLAQYEHRSSEHMTDPLIGQTYKELVELVGGRVDVVFSNTHEYDDYFKKWLPDAEHIVFDEARETVPISSTLIRTEGVFTHWDKLPKAVQRFYLKRVAFVGWESSGKTFTSNILAEKFGTSFVPEYGRTYFDELGGYSSVEDANDYVNIASGHLQALHYATGNKILIVDTDLVYTQFFYQETHGKLHPVLDALIKADADKINIRVFLEPHNKLNQDGTRKRLNDIERQKTSNRLKALYAYYDIDLIIIDELDEACRLNKATQMVENAITRYNFG